jgi:uncharacterized membrane protein
MLTKYLAAYGTTLVVFLIIDGVWLGVVARSFYVQQIGDLLRPAPNFGVAGLFYALYVVVFPALHHGTWLTAALFGALFGLVAYATYDLTNLATLQGWPVVMSVVDMVWGAVLTASVSVVSFLIVSRIFDAG